MPAIGSRHPASILPWLAATYMLLAALATVLQHRLARHDASHDAGGTPESPWPSVDVVVPSFNEDPSLLRLCLASILGQRYEGKLRVWVVDDGSSNWVAIRPVYDEFAMDARCQLIRLPYNRGKRLAQDAAVRRGEADIFVNIDSDTVLSRDALTNIIKLFRDQRVAMATGNVRPSNRDANELTRLVGVRYRLLFEVERGAQSRFESVLCCSGSFSAYRRSAIREVWSEYLGQRFLSFPCTYGEDLHLTVRLLAKGYRSLFAPQAIADTKVPGTLRGYLRQQLRWNRSFYRELRWIVPLLARRPAYLTLDVVARFLLPLLLPIAVVLAGVSAASNSGTLLLDTVLLMGMVVSHLGVMIWATREPRFSVLYGLVYVALLIPLRLYALCTPMKPHWGTRHPVGEPRLG